MNFHASPSPGESARETEHRELARECARDGMVLLANDGTLPLRPGRIALYGSGARWTFAGGTGSGEVQPRSVVTVEQGLADAGFDIATGAYLDDYDREQAQTYADFRARVTAEIAGIADPMAALHATFAHHYVYPPGRAITDADIAESGTDTAIYVLSRQAGEGDDRQDEAGDYRLTQTEIDNLALLGRSYAHAILVINVGGTIDLSALDAIEGIGAIIYAVQPGMAGGQALADLLTGASDFTGRLTDTWPAHYAAVPYGDRFGTGLTECYHEDLFVGYRYCETFDVRPRYPFGFGLSYTSWTLHTAHVGLVGRMVTMEVDVTNVGDLASRQVVQAYLAPRGAALPTPAQSLVAFAKSRRTSPGATSRVSLSFDLADAASWDPARSAWILDAEAYVVKVGSSSAETTPAAVLTVTEPIVTCQATRRLAPAEDFETLAPPAAGRVAVDDSLPRLVVDAAAFDPERVVHCDQPESPEATVILNRLTTEQHAELLTGGDLRSAIAGSHRLVGSGGLTCNRLLDEGVPNVIVLDGPAGLNVTPTHLRLNSAGELRPAEVPDKYNWGGAIAAMTSQMVSAEGKDYWRWATAFPVGLLLAQTWDTELMERVGRAIAAEMLEFGVTGWLAPAMNLHRNPLAGRNFEYFSEDPLVTGLMAAAVTRGVQSRPGLSATLKHFAGNERERDRLSSDSVISERALRELYLKGFEIAVRHGRPRAVMTSYNLINGIYAANSVDLLDGILREEWGFDGLVMTDWGATADGYADPARCAAAGNDLIMPGDARDRALITDALADGRLSPAEVRRCAARVLRFVLAGVSNLQESQ